MQVEKDIMDCIYIYIYIPYICKYDLSNIHVSYIFLVSLVIEWLIGYKLVMKYDKRRIMCTIIRPYLN